MCSSLLAHTGLYGASYKFTRRAINSASINVEPTDKIEINKPAFV
jgi:hypothetical protein